MQAPGRVPATSETFISPSQEYAQGYDDVTARFSARAGTQDALTYDAAGNLIVQADPGKVTYYPGGGAEEIIYDTAVTPATVTAQRFYSAPDGTQIIRSSDGTISYQTANQQDTALESVSAATLAITRRYYDPYGNPAGTTPRSWPDANGFTGRPADPATSLDLLGARQYNPATGTFLSLDPELETGDPLQMGGYAYAADNPATGSDPTGLSYCADGHCYSPTPPAPDPPAPASPTTPSGGSTITTIIAQAPHSRQLAAAYTAQLGPLGHTFGAHVPQYIEWLAFAHACSLNPGLCNSDLQGLAINSAAQGQASYQVQTAGWYKKTATGSPWIEWIGAHTYADVSLCWIICAEVATQDGKVQLSVGGIEGYAKPLCLDRLTCGDARLLPGFCISLIGFGLWGGGGGVNFYTTRQSEPVTGGVAAALPWGAAIQGTKIQGTSRIRYGGGPTYGVGGFVGLMYTFYTS